MPVPPISAANEEEPQPRVFTLAGFPTAGMPTSAPLLTRSAAGVPNSAAVLNRSATGVPTSVGVLTRSAAGVPSSVGVPTGIVPYEQAPAPVPASFSPVLGTSNRSASQRAKDRSDVEKCVMVCLEAGKITATDAASFWLSPDLTHCLQSLLSGCRRRVRSGGGGRSERRQWTRGKGKGERRIGEEAGRHCKGKGVRRRAVRTPRLTATSSYWQKKLRPVRFNSS